MGGDLAIGLDTDGALNPKAQTPEYEYEYAVIWRGHA